MIQIGFSKSGQYLKCSVIDSGIGLEKSSKKSKIHSLGVALKNIQNRIQFIKKEYPKTSFEIRELKDELNQVKGTKAVLFIPFTTN